MNLWAAGSNISNHITFRSHLKCTRHAALSRCVGTFQSGGVSSAWTMSFSLCYLNELFRAAIGLKYFVRAHIFYEFFYFIFLHLRVPVSVSVHPEGQGLVSSFSCMHQLMDEPPSSVCLGKAQNAPVRNKSYSILFWASVSGALGCVLKCESTFVTPAQSGDTFI